MTRRYTDSSLTLLVKNKNLTSASHVYVTFSQYSPEDVRADDAGSIYRGGLASKESVTIECTNVSYVSPNSVLVVALNQEQSSKFKNGYLRVQVNWLDSGNKRHATVVKKIRHRPNIYEEVLS